MASITDTYALDMTPGAIPAVVHLSQYDSGTREIKFLLYAGSRPYEPPTGSTVTIRGGKPDGTIYEYACTVSGDAASIQPTAQMTAVKGFHDAEVRVYNGSDVIGSANLRIMVEPSPFPESYRASATELPIIEGAEKAALEANDSKNAALNSQNAASSSATQAASSATAASKSASAAATSEKNAGSSASTASSKADAASSSASQAASSATAASKSASAAAQSEKNAMSATPDGYQELASTFNSLGLYVDEDGDICQKDD